MKIKILVTIALIAFLNVGTVTKVSAQSVRAARVKIDFDFQIRNKHFPAGEYLLETVRFGLRDALSIKGTGKNKSAIIVIANQLYADNIQPRKIIFARRGENLVLSGAFLDNGRWGLSIPVGGKQKREDPAAVSSLVFELTF
jgi:hypothetical protein